jgi:hypothetical protein
MPIIALEKNIFAFFSTKVLREGGVFGYTVVYADGRDNEPGPAE